MVDFVVCRGSCNISLNHWNIFGLIKGNQYFHSISLGAFKGVHGILLNALKIDGGEKVFITLF